MITPKQAGAALRSYLENVSDEQFLEDMLRYNPHLAAEAKEQTRSDNHNMNTPLRFEAYIASALTLLTDRQRRFVDGMSDVVKDVCARLDINAYEPRSQTDPKTNQHISDVEVFNIDRKRIAAADLLIMLCDYPSFGAGQELDLAFNAFTPVLLISHIKTPVSRMVTGVPSVKLHIKYEELDDLEIKLQEGLTSFLPRLEQHKAVVKQHASENIVGMNIRRYRKELGLEPAQLAAKSQLITEATLELLENFSDGMANPSLMQLRHLADILGVKVEDLLSDSPFMVRSAS